MTKQHAILTFFERNHLNGCPFCGYPALSLIVEEGERPVYTTIYYVTCPICLANGPMSGDKEEAIKKWNTRINEPLAGLKRKEGGTNMGH